VITLIDWEHPETDPIRRQFLPLGGELLSDHPMARLDSLSERASSPVPGLTHRYPDKALFLTQDRCPVYCRFCTRSYAVGLDTDDVRKDHVGAQGDRWERAFDYLRQHEEVEDVVISGGDSYSLRADQVRLIGNTLLEIPHIRRMRFATKGLAVMPMKILTDEAWTDALVEVAKRGRKLHKEVCVHTHFNHPREITGISQRATSRLFEEGITVRNQAVLLRGVNDEPDTMRLLVKRLSHINVQPYYVFQHDLVTGVEDLRTTLGQTIELEKQVRGLTAGFNCPTFVVDTPGGGGKRDVHSYEYYNQVTGVSVFRSPNIDRSSRYMYFDPIDQLPEEGQERWADEREHDRIVGEALSAAGSS
jgi:lysine 2,3-aminomutase